MSFLARCLFVLVVLLGPLSPTPASPQTTPPTKPRLTFDVATIRLSDPRTTGGYIKAIPGGHGYTASHIPVRLMFSLMYRVPIRQISGGPAWFNTELYDVEARADGPHTLEDLHTMFQNLLADRFNLKFHTETHEGNVYALTVDKAGIKMKLDTTPEDFAIPMNFSEYGSVTGRRVSMNYFSWWLGNLLQEDERPVLNLTGLPGNYDFSLSFQDRIPAEASKESIPADLADRPSIFEAVRNQLGLQLIAQKGPVVRYIIDHVDRPSNN